MPTRYVYVTGGREVAFDDPADVYKPEDIKAHWAATFPELGAATWEVTEKDGVKIVTFAKKVGTKGGEWPDWVSVTEQLPEFDVPVLIFAYHGNNDWFAVVAYRVIDTHPEREEGDWYWEILSFMAGFWTPEIMPQEIDYWMPFPTLPLPPEAQ